MSRAYVISVSLLTFVLPAALVLGEHLIYRTPLDFALAFKWFVFSAVGLRLALAGAKQILQPGFTAKGIFRISTPEVFPIVRELGFANFCFGALGIASLPLPGWRAASAFASGIYYGLAGALHLFRKGRDANETFALATDAFIFVVLAAGLLVLKTG